MVDASNAMTSTFREASESWLTWATTRTRRRIRETSKPSIRSALDKWILPEIGDILLPNVHNKSVKPLVQKMKDAGLAPKSIQTYTNLIKTVMASILDEETGEPVFMRKWNATVLDLPIVKDQKTPCFEAKEIEMLLTITSGWEHMLYLVLAATGLRIGEALALEAKHVIRGGRSLNIEQQVSRFGDVVPYTKTDAGKREVDLHPDITSQLVPFVQGKKGLLFPTRNGTPRLPGNVEKRTLAVHNKKGFHAFRRYRESWLSEMSCNPDLRLFWLGHRPETMSEIYSKICRNVKARLAEAERVGVGFDPKTKGMFEKRGHKYYPTETKTKAELKRERDAIIRAFNERVQAGEI